MQYIYPLLLGPFAQPRWRDVFLRLFFVGVLTITTQVGGVLIWPSLCISTNNIGFLYQIQRITMPIICYLLGTWWVVPVVAAPFNSVPLPCSSTKEYPLAPRSYLTCLTNRNYVHSSVKDDLLRTSKIFGRLYANVDIHYLDVGFPIRGMPTVPNLSHVNGKTVDVSFIWNVEGLVVPSPSPIGYGNELKFVQSVFSDAKIHKPKTKQLVSFIEKSKQVKTILVNFDLKLHKEKTKKTKFINGTSTDFFTVEFY